MSMALTERIRQYFFINFDRLTVSRGFHFASRLAAWEGSTEAINKLNQLRPYMLPGDSHQVLTQLLDKPLGPIYADELRRNYFDQYPRLHGINSALFHLRHLKEVYNIDWRNDFLELVSPTELDTLADQLSSDREALQWLSSFAVNYLYLLEKLYDRQKLNPQLFLNLYEHYDKQNTQQLNLLFYLFTHCVIADSNFYIETISDEKLAVYRRMMSMLDSLTEKPDFIKLDTQLEYLVASRICQRLSPLHDSIHQQIESQFSEERGYILDPKSKADDNKINSLNVSEHRNVLFIMSSSEFRPHRIRLSYAKLPSN